MKKLAMPGSGIQSGKRGRGKRSACRTITRHWPGDGMTRVGFRVADTKKPGSWWPGLDEVQGIFDDDDACFLLLFCSFWGI